MHRKGGLAHSVHGHGAHEMRRCQPGASGSIRAFFRKAALFPFILPLILSSGISEAKTREMNLSEQLRSGISAKKAPAVIRGGSCWMDGGALVRQDGQGRESRYPAHLDGAGGVLETRCSGRRSFIRSRMRLEMFQESGSDNAPFRLSHTSAVFDISSFSNRIIAWTDSDKEIFILGSDAVTTVMPIEGGKDNRAYLMPIAVTADTKLAYRDGLVFTLNGFSQLSISDYSETADGRFRTAQVPADIAKSGFETCGSNLAIGRCDGERLEIISDAGLDGLRIIKKK